MKRLSLMIVCLLTGIGLNYLLKYDINSIEYWGILFPYFITGCIYRFKEN